ncbi:MAG: DUF1593 domain-containing protein [Opitutaceae bacterium]|jgi:hypothetical protein
MIRLLLAFLTIPLLALADSRPRLLILTDIGGDPDDQQSLVRLLVYANEFQIEGLVATSAGVPGQLKTPATRPDLIRTTVAAYGEVLPHLERHAPGWPSANALLGTVKTGNPLRGRDYIGENHDTEASRWIVSRADVGDPDHPLNIAVWGGQTDLAQALWRVKQDRGEAGLRNFTRLLRVYDVDDQDGLAGGIASAYHGINYILSSAASGEDKRRAAYRGMYLGGDESLTGRDWIDKNIRSRGPLGALYPVKTWTAPNPHNCLKEGDTPSWFFFLPLGGNDPLDPSKPGWGGEYRRDADGIYRDAVTQPGGDPRETVNRWRPAFQADFARRMTWCLPK